MKTGDTFVPCIDFYRQFQEDVLKNHRNFYLYISWHWTILRTIRDFLGRFRTILDDSFETLPSAGPLVISIRRESCGFYVGMCIKIQRIVQTGQENLSLYIIALDDSFGQFSPSLDDTGRFIPCRRYKRGGPGLAYKAPTCLRNVPSMKQAIPFPDAEKMRV